MSQKYRQKGRGSMQSHYVSTPLSPECLKGLKAVQTALADDARKLDFRFSGTDDAHFTFTVFRTASEAQRQDQQFIESVNEALKEFLSKRPKIELAFGGLGSFGSKIFYIEIANSVEVTALRTDMNEMLKEEGLIVADNRFTPHVTLFRSKYSGGGADSSTLTNMKQRTDLPPVPASPVEKVILKRLLGS